MADEHGLFFNSVDGDRVYDADSFSEWLAPFFKNGVFLNSFQPTASGGMNVTISSGIGYIDGKLRTLAQNTTIEIEPASGSYPRIDTIVFERNDTAREMTIHAVTGAYAGSNPAASAPVRENNIYQLVLCQVYVPAGATSIKAANITDKRFDTSVCGYVSNAIQSPDFEKWYNLNQTKFEEWFAAVKNTLSDDVSGNLLNLINANKDNINAVNDRIDNLSSDSVKMSDGNSTSDSIKFGVDSNGNYGYYKQGEATVTPFRHPTGDAQPDEVVSGKVFSTADGEDLVGMLRNYASAQELSDSLSKAWHFSSSYNYISVYLNDPTKDGGKLWSNTRPIRFDGNGEIQLKATAETLNAEGLYTKAQYDKYGSDQLAKGKNTGSHVYGDDITVSVTKDNEKSSGSASKTVTVPSGAKLWVNLFPSVVQAYGNTKYEYGITTKVSYGLSGTNLTIRLNASGSTEVKSTASVVVRLYYIS